MSHLNAYTDIPPKSDMSYVNFMNEGVGLKEEDVTVEIDEKYNAVDFRNLRKAIEMIWERTCACKPYMTNDLLFRFGDYGLPGELPAGAGEHPEGGEEEEEGEEEEAAEVEPLEKLTLRLGLTSMKEYLGTNCLPYIDIAKLGELATRFYCHKTAYFANPLAVGILLGTADNRFVLVRRDVKCLEAPRLIDRPTSSPDPCAIPLPRFERDLAKAVPEDVVQEIFRSAKRAAACDLGINMTNIIETELMGVALNLPRGGRPTLEFVGRCDLDSTQIIYKYNRCCQYRNTQVLFTSEEELRYTPIKYSTLYMGLSAAAKAAVMLYRERAESIFPPPEEGEEEEGGEEG